MTINRMESYETPNKRMKFEDPDNDNVWDGDDFQWENIDEDNNEQWEDLTAEEIAMAEEQEKEATQKFQHDLTVDLQIPSTSKIQKLSLTQSSQGFDKAEDMKNQIYILEGRNKSLVNSINSEQLEKKKLLETLEKQQKERQLENERFQTELQLREHAEKQYRSEIQVLKHKLEKSKNNGTFISSQQIATHSRSTKCGKFITEFDKIKTVETSVQTSTSVENDIEQRRQFKLSLIMPADEQSKTYDLSRFLMLQQQNLLPAAYSYFGQTSPNSIVSENINFMSSNLTLLNINMENENIWEEYDKLLKRHVLFLQNTIFTNQKRDSLDNSQINSSFSMTFNIFTSSQAADIESQHATVVHCLTDLKELLLHNCPPQILSNSALNSVNEQVIRQQMEQDLCSAPLFVDQLSQELPLLSSLIILAKKETYPESYDYADEEIVLTLNALASWSSHHPQGSSSIFPHIYNHLTIQSFLSGQHGIPCTLATLQLLTNFVRVKDFDQLLHKNEGCAFITVAGLCHVVRSSSPEESSLIFSLVQNFLSVTLAVLGNSALQSVKCHCSYQIVQGFILMLHHHFEIYNDDSIDNGLQILKKGIMLLHELSLLVNHFEKLRLPVDDEYVLLISCLSRLVEEDQELKCLTDAIHELADFNKKRDDSPEDYDEGDGNDISTTQSCSPMWKSAIGMKTFFLDYF